MKTTYIYGIKDLEIDKFIYIGKSGNPEHRYGRLKHSHNELVRQFARDKGEDNFQIEILQTVNFEGLRDWVKQEKFWIERLRKEGHPLCNKNSGGGGATEHTEEWKREASVRNSGENNPMYGKDMSGENNPMYGRHHTEEAIIKQKEYWTPKRRKEQSARQIGESNSFYGKHHTKEIRARQSEANSGKNNPMYGLIGKKNPNYGRSPSEETRANLSKALSGERNPMYGKPAWNRGIPRSQEVKDKIGRRTAKPYPAFYNVKMNEFIPAGINLKKMCREHLLSYGGLWNLTSGGSKSGFTSDGWCLATASEIEIYGDAA